MNGSGIRPTQFTLCTLLKSCSKMLNQHFGRQLHGLIIRIGYDDNVFLNSALVNLYAKCGDLVDARKVFGGMKKHDKVSWTSIITGLSQNGHGEEALLVFKDMLQTDIRPNCFTYVSMVAACTKLESAFYHGVSLHAHVIKHGLEPNSFLTSSLIDFYSKYGEINQAMLLFDYASIRDTVVCNSMIAGFSRNELGYDALNLFNDMWTNGMGLTNFTFGSILNACGSLAVHQVGKQIHALGTKMGLDGDVFMSCSLIDMYSKCGAVEEARCVFNYAGKRNIILWTSMITCYAQNGREADGLKLFEELTSEGMKPDHVCFTAVLTACNHAGFLDKGTEYFKSMTTAYNLIPELDQYACMVDLYGRSGLLRKAKKLMEDMPFEPNAVMWSSLLGSCRVYGQVELGKEAACQLFKREPWNATPYIALASLYAEAGMWDGVSEVKKLMDYKGLRKRAGWSWVEADE